MLFVAEYGALRDLGRYGLLVVIIYFIGVIVMVPIATYWCEGGEDRSSSFGQFRAKFLRLVLKHYGIIFVICIFWPLTPIFLWFVGKFPVFEAAYLVGAVAIGLVAFEIVSKAPSSTLVSVLKEDPGYRTRVASRLLAERADRQTIEPLMALAAQGSPDDVRSAAVYALRPFSDVQVLDLLVSELTNPAGRATGAASYALNHNDAPLLVEKLLPFLKHDDPDISRRSSEILKALIKRLILAGTFDPKAVDSQIDQTIQEYAALWAQRDRAMIAPSPVLRKRKHISGTLSNYVVVMGLVDTPRSTTTLIGLLGNPDMPRGVRWIAASSLGRESASADAVQALALALEMTREGSVRHPIVVSLGDIGDQSAVPRLVKSLTDWNVGKGRVGDIQIEAANALSKMGWVPKNIRDTVHLATATKDKEWMLEQWTDTKRVLLDDVVSQEPNPLNNALLTFIRLGKDEVLPDLVSILEEQGRLPMANAFLRSGNDVLNSAARKWAAANGYVVDTVEVATGYPKWGN